MENRAENIEGIEYDEPDDLFELAKTARISKIYSYTILGGEEVKSIQIISSCSSETFENTIINRTLSSCCCL